MFSSHYRILQGIPVAGDRQDYVAVLPTIAGIPPEMAQGTGQHAHKPCLQILGEEVRTSFNNSFLDVTGSQTLCFRTLFMLLKITEDLNNYLSGL